MRELHVLNLGAGVQSTALYLLAREPDAKLRFDVAIFADTGDEPTAVCVLSAWCVEVTTQGTHANLPHRGHVRVTNSLAASTTAARSHPYSHEQLNPFNSTSQSLPSASATTSMKIGSGRHRTSASIPSEKVATSAGHPAVPAFCSFAAYWLPATTRSPTTSRHYRSVARGAATTGQVRSRLVGSG